MRICYDARVVGRRRSGIPRFAWMLLKHLPRAAPQHIFFVFCRKNSVAEIKAEVPSAEVVEAEVPVYSIAEQFHVPRLLRRISPHLYHTPTYAAPLWQPSSTLITIYDLIPMIFPRYFRLVHRIYYPFIVRGSARRAAAVLTVSESARRDISEKLGVPESRVHVVNAGVDEFFFEPDSDPSSPIQGPYVLGVGNEKPHKEIAGLIKAFQRIGRRPELRLALVGQLSDEANRLLAMDARLKERVVVFGVVDDATLRRLYRHAAVFVFPSLYEGFGLPPLEAMACGAPVIVSDAPALIETVGDAGLIVPRRDYDGFAEAIERVLEDAALRQDLIRKGTARAHQFRWDDAAQRVAELYETLCG